MESTTNNDILQLLKDFAEIEFVKRIRSHFVVCDLDVPNPKYIRVGKDFDGGYIMLDDFDGIKNAYSGGISTDVSWDEMMAERGIDIFQYDHTIERLPKEHPKFHWVKTGLIGYYSSNHPELETLPRLIIQNGHEDDHNMIFKMDIEGAEYSVFQAIDETTLGRFKQIVLELHFLMNPSFENALGLCLDKINATHQLVHVHANNFGRYIIRGGLILPDVIEVTYLRRTDYKFVKSRRFFPAAIDMPNYPGSPDIPLGYWG